MFNLVVALLSLFAILATPVPSFATPILYSVSGIATSAYTGETIDWTQGTNVSGYAVISDEPISHCCGAPPFGADDCVHFTIENYILALGNGAFNYGSGEIRFEILYGTGINGLDTHFYHSDGSPYPQMGYPDIIYTFGEYFQLAPIITMGPEGPGPSSPLHIGFSDGIGYFLDLKLTSVPEPSTILLLGSGLIGLWGFRRKPKK